MYVCMSVCLYVCMSVCLYVCMSVCICIYACIYITLSLSIYACIYMFCGICDENSLQIMHATPHCSRAKCTDEREGHERIPEHIASTLCKALLYDMCMHASSWLLTDLHDASAMVCASSCCMHAVFPIILANIQLATINHALESSSYLRLPCDFSIFCQQEGGPLLPANYWIDLIKRCTASSRIPRYVNSIQNRMIQMIAPIRLAAAHDSTTYLSSNQST